MATFVIKNTVLQPLSLLGNGVLSFGYLWLLGPLHYIESRKYYFGLHLVYCATDTIPRNFWPLHREADLLLKQIVVHEKRVSYD